jgi:hypothetical protein
VRVTVDYEVCKSAISLYLNVIERVCNQAANKSNHPKYNQSFRHAYPLHVTYLVMAGRVAACNETEIS